MMGPMKKENIRVHPSILAGDFGCLAEEARRLEEAGADAVHIDVMDGHFVPNLTLGPKAVAAIRRSTSLFLDVHLMIYNPFDYIERFVEAGADNISFHFEATEDVADTLEFIRRCNIKAGLAFNPETSESMIPKYLPICDMVLLMTVNPGFGGQAFIPEVLEKIAFTRKLIDESGLAVDIEVDGGIDPKTAKECVARGANVLVAGTYTFQQPNLSQAIQSLRGIHGD
jgi:ribulose-phosphate 3-epimerase